MMCLFLDTSSNYLTISLIKNNKAIKTVYENVGNDLSKYALVRIKQILLEHNIKPNEIDKIICVNGPGSFTSLRIGVTIAKTYAWGLEKKIIPVSSLFVMATSIKNYDYIIPIIDARREYFFAGIYDDNYKSVLSDTYISKEELLKEVNKLKNYVFVSTKEIDGIDCAIYTPDIDNLLKHLEEKEVNPQLLVPNYLKKTEAEENLDD